MSPPLVVVLNCCEEIVPCAEQVEAASRLRRYTHLKRVFLFLAFLALSLNLRASITSLPPVIEELQRTLHISTGLAGFLTSIPVLCFGFLTPLMGWGMKRTTLETSIVLTLVGIVLGSLVRSAGTFYTALLGTTIIGLALTMGNIAGLMVLGRDFKRNASTMTGFYVCGMSLGSTWTTGMTAPLAEQFGWQFSLAAIPIGLAVTALLLWAGVSYFQQREAQLLGEVEPYPAGAAVESGIAPAKARSRLILREAMVWLLSAAFAAHTFLFYGMTAWLPSYLKEAIGFSASQAGLAASLFQVLGIVGCMGIPALAASKRCSQMGLFLVVTLSWLATAIGYFLWPQAWLLWTLFGGIGSGGGFTVIFGLVMQYARNLDENRVVSTVIQTIGYAVASVSPVVIGHIYTATGSWAMSFRMLAGAAVVMTLCGILASRQGHV